jgi:hypothetical protein
MGTSRRDRISLAVVSLITRIFSEVSTGFFTGSSRGISFSALVWQPKNMKTARVFII